MNSTAFRLNRIRLGLTQKALGESIGLTQNMIAKIEGSDSSMIRYTTELAFRYIALTEHKTELLYEHQFDLDLDTVTDKASSTVQQKGLTGSFCATRIHAGECSKRNV